MHLRLKISGPVAIGGHRPGEEFLVRCDDDGVPEDTYWRRRLADEEASPGHIETIAVED